MAMTVLCYNEEGHISSIKIYCIIWMYMAMTVLLCYHDDDCTVLPWRWLYYCVSVPEEAPPTGEGGGRGETSSASFLQSQESQQGRVQGNSQEGCA